MTDMRSLIFFVSILFCVAYGNNKYCRKLINATENFLLNFFSFIFFLQTELFLYPSYSHLIKIKVFRYKMGKNIA